MGMNDVPRCQHVKLNGTQCGSPALRRKRHCHFHHRMQDGRKRYGQGEVSPRPMYSMSLLEDANSVQVALMQVLELLACGQMEPRVAGLMLYGLQIASSNLKNTKFEADNSTDVIIDRQDVRRTCIDGPQWFEEDFGTGERDEQPETLKGGEPEDGEDENETESAQEEELPEQERTETASVRLMKAKAPVENSVSIEEARKRVQGMVRNFLLDMMPPKSAANPG
jgi:hypothetical protein